MNIKVNLTPDELTEYLLQAEEQILVGSRAWGTSNPSSDFDYVVVGKNTGVLSSRFKYGELQQVVSNKSDFIFVNDEYFEKLATQGGDALMFEASLLMQKDFKYNWKKIAKMYAGLAHRDLKQYMKEKDVFKYRFAKQSQMICTHILLETKIDLYDLKTFKRHTENPEYKDYLEKTENLIYFYKDLFKGV